jgi:hypothetical protein
VKNQTPKVDKQEKGKSHVGRAKVRLCSWFFANVIEETNLQQKIRQRCCRSWC